MMVRLTSLFLVAATEALSAFGAIPERSASESSSSNGLTEASIHAALTLENFLNRQRSSESCLPRSSFTDDDDLGTRIETTLKFVSHFNRMANISYDLTAPDGISLYTMDFERFSEYPLGEDEMNVEDIMNLVQSYNIPDGRADGTAETGPSAMSPYLRSSNWRDEYASNPPIESGDRFALFAKEPGTIFAPPQAISGGGSAMDGSILSLLATVSISEGQYYSQFQRNGYWYTTFGGNITRLSSSSMPPVDDLTNVVNAIYVREEPAVREDCEDRPVRECGDSAAVTIRVIHEGSSLLRSARATDDDGGEVFADSKSIILTTREPSSSEGMIAGWTAPQKISRSSRRIVPVHTTLLPQGGSIQIHHLQPSLRLTRSFTSPQITASPNADESLHIESAQAADHRPTKGPRK